MYHDVFNLRHHKILGYLPILNPNRALEQLVRYVLGHNNLQDDQPLEKEQMFDTSYNEENRSETIVMFKCLPKVCIILPDP